MSLRKEPLIDLRNGWCGSLIEKNLPSKHPGCQTVEYEVSWRLFKGFVNPLGKDAFVKDDKILDGEKGIRLIDLYDANGKMFQKVWVIIMDKDGYAPFAEALKFNIKELGKKFYELEIDKNLLKGKARAAEHESETTKGEIIANVHENAKKLFGKERGGYDFGGEIVKETE